MRIYAAVDVINANKYTYFYTAIRLSRIRQVAPMCQHGGTLAPPGEYDWTCAHWRHRANTTELVLAFAHPSPQPKWQIDRLSCFCTAHSRKSL